jgi:hypothetical protein
MNTESLKAWSRFVEVFNDTKKYPSVAHVAVELDISYQTVRNKAAIARKLSATEPSFPRIVSRSPKTEKAVSDDLSPEEHAQNRANALSADIHDLITGTDYPVVNPDAVKVESFLVKVYDRGLQGYTEVEGKPRTWLSDTLKVEGVKQVAGRKFLFTGAQNDAPVHKEFWKNLKAYAHHIGAEVIVGPWTYETSWWSENNPTSRRYDPAILDHMCFGQMALGDSFVFCGEMNTIPTASRPISDLTTYSRGKWAVFPHAKLQLKSVPSTDPAQQAHQVMTTGAVTLPKVVARKAGIKSIFHHVLGATLVEFDQKSRIFCRQISATEDGAFQDLDRKVANGRVTKGHGVKAIVCPDVHRRKLSNVTSRAIFGLDIKTGAHVTGSSMFERLKPEYAFIHDLLDFEARNHHHDKDNAHFYEMAFRNRDSVFEEVKQAAEFLAKIKRPGLKIKVVESNHDLALQRWVSEGRYRLDGRNIRYGLQLEDAYLDYRQQLAEALDAEDEAPSFSLFEHAARLACGSALEGIDWIHDGRSFRLDGIECGQHGFRGANGARGTVTGYAALGCKMSIGDKHSPEILDGVYVSGVMQLQHGYNKGPSGWGVACTIQYGNGKRTLITLQEGHWHA